MTSSDRRKPEARPHEKHESPGEKPLVARVFAELADGQFHSGEQLAEALGVSRSAVWKAVESLRELGATLHAVRNRGYRLAKSGEPLEAGRIAERLSEGVRARVRALERSESTRLNSSH